MPSDGPCCAFVQPCAKKTSTSTSTSALVIMHFVRVWQTSAQSRDGATHERARRCLESRAVKQPKYSLASQAATARKIFKASGSSSFVLFCDLQAARGHCLPSAT
eukprot:scaffold18323_cov42-Prasinocladus_malaysianus.AAC.1